MDLPIPDLLPDDLKSELGRFRAADDAAARPYLQHLQAQTPVSIFHYTREDSLKGILSTGTFRLTDSWELNDPTELTHGLNLLNEVFAEAAKHGPSELSYFGDRVKGFVERWGAKRSPHHFVGSFSLLGDDLPQWRSYADDGRGFALEFNARELDRTLEHKGLGFNTASFPVGYDDDIIRELYREQIKLVSPLVSLPRNRPISRQNILRWYFSLEQLFLTGALFRSILFKHPAYASEQEYRFLQIIEASSAKIVKTEVRQRGEENLKYRALDWLCEAPKALSAVIIGPASVGLPGPRLRAREWLDAAGLQHVPIRESRLPYRAFNTSSQKVSGNAEDSARSFPTGRTEAKDVGESTA